MPDMAVGSLGGGGGRSPGGYYHMDNRDRGGSMDSTMIWYNIILPIVKI